MDVKPAGHFIRTHLEFHPLLDESRRRDGELPFRREHRELLRLHRRGDALVLVQSEYPAAETFCSCGRLGNDLRAELLVCEELCANCIDTEEREDKTRRKLQSISREARNFYAPTPSALGSSGVR
jgi:hypothetical protein